jgi:hypothetical protein
MNDDSVWVALICCFLGGGMFGLIFGGFVAGGEYKAQAIERGYAQYCPDDGGWEWIGECGE